MIPKVIHYCWFGLTDLPEKDKRCIESWKKYCPDYEIKRWDETNYDINKNQYMKEAYDARKWGFVPDYARLDIVYTFGGIYLDTDVELTRNIDDLLENKAYMGFEDGKLVNPGLGFGAEKENEVIGSILHTIYDNRHFLMENGDLDMIPSPIMNTEFLIKRGLKQNNTIQNIDGLIVYSKEFFCPIDPLSGVKTETKEMHSIHHFHASWLEPEVLIENQGTQRLRRRFGNKMGDKLGRILYFPLRIKMKLRQKGFWGTIKFAVGKLVKVKKK